MFNRKELDERTLQILEDILSKDVNDLIYNDKAFLKARSGYLTSHEREMLKNILSEELVAPEPEQEAGPTYKELQSRAKSLGMVKTTAVSREELEAFIRSAEGPATTI